MATKRFKIEKSLNGCGVRYLPLTPDFVVTIGTTAVFAEMAVSKLGLDTEADQGNSKAKAIVDAVDLLGALVDSFLFSEEECDD